MGHGVVKRCVPAVAITAILVAVTPATGAVEEDRNRALVEAAARGDAVRVTALLRAGADPDARDAGGMPSLVRAVASVRPAAVRALLRGGADPDRAGRSGWTALLQAAETGSVEAARLLLDAGAIPDARDRVRGTALDVAEQSGHADVARLLRARGARGSGKALGDVVCVRRWGGAGFCGVVEGAERMRYRLRVTTLHGCEHGCEADAACSAGRPVGGVGGLRAPEALWVLASCLTHTGLR